MNATCAFFVTRGKSNLAVARMYSKKIDQSLGVRCDQTSKLTTCKSSPAYPQKLRRVKYYDQEQEKTDVFLTNNFDSTALEVALFYQHRWKVELFFKWSKQHLKIKSFWGASETAVKTQSWIAICTYLMVAMIRKELGRARNRYEILPIISVSIFDKTPLKQLLHECQLQNPAAQLSKELYERVRRFL